MSRVVNDHALSNRDGASGAILSLVVLSVASAALVIGLTAPKLIADFIAAPAYEYVEPPPAEYAGVKVDGVTERKFDSPAELDAFCRSHLGATLEGEHYRACYVPTDQIIALPSKWAVESRAERQALRAHEMGHAAGWRHPLTRERMAALRLQLGLN